jgi:hypothetical protein
MTVSLPPRAYRVADKVPCIAPAVSFAGSAIQGFRMTAAGLAAGAVPMTLASVPPFTIGAHPLDARSITA